MKENENEILSLSFFTHKTTAWIDTMILDIL